MTSGQKAFPVAASKFKFARHGKSGAWLSELLPHTAGVADELCIVRSMHTEAINHDPAITFFQTGSRNSRAGRASAPGSSYGLGSEQPGPAGVRASSSRAAAAGPPISRSTTGCGAAAFCRRSTRASSSAASAIRCSTCRTRPASARTTRRAHAGRARAS